MVQRLSVYLFAVLAISLGSELYAETIRIGSWNIEHLGFPGSRYGDAADIAQEPQHLADHIESAGVDVLALQEIGDTADPGRVSETLDDVMELLGQDGADWTYELGANKNEGDRTQLTGVAWNRSRVTKVGEPLRFSMQFPSSGFNHWDRHPTAFKFQVADDKTDFVVVSLHLKAGTSGSNRQQRAEEAQALAARLGPLRTVFKERDLILIGDINVRSTTEAALTAFTSAGFVDLNATGETTVPWGDAPFDHIFVPAGQPEFAGATMTRVVTDNDDQRRRLSDHFLIYTDIQVQDDDDEDVAFGGDGDEEEGEPPVEPAPGNIQIIALLPNPVGPDHESESLTIGNGGASDVSLVGWKLVDRADNEFTLSGEIPASATISVNLEGKMPLNQGGDTVRLINSAGNVVHEVSYTGFQVTEGQFITF